MGVMVSLRRGIREVNRSSLCFRYRNFGFVADTFSPEALATNIV